MSVWDNYINICIKNWSGDYIQTSFYAFLFFEERKTDFISKLATDLLKYGKAKVKGLYSPRTGKTYDGIVVLADTGGKYVNYRIEIPTRRSKPKGEVQ